MSQIIVNIPGCDGATSQGGTGDTITIQTDQCPPIVQGPPPLVPWWAWVVGAVIVLAFIIATAIVRFRRQERLESENDNAQQVALAKANQKTTQCPTCGTVYVPETKSK